MRTPIPYNRLLDAIRVALDTDRCSNCTFQIERDDKRAFGANWHRGPFSINCTDRCQIAADKAVGEMMSMYDVAWPEENSN